MPRAAKQPTPRTRASAGKARVQDRPARPEPQVYRIEKPSPEVEQLLLRWETESAKIRKMKGSFDRIVYDEVFGVAKHAKGEFYYEAPDKGTYEVQGLEVPPNAVSKKKTKSGQPYRLTSDQDERWICDGQQILQINDVEKTYRVIEIPPESRGENIMDGPLPFLFGMKAEQAKQRYRFELKEQSEARIWIIAYPLWKQDAQNYKKAEVILDPKTFLPIGVQLLDPTGNKVTMHSFPADELTVNPRNFLPIRDPLKPNLSRYKRILESEIVPTSGIAPRTTRKPAATSRRTSTRTQRSPGRANPGRRTPLPGEK